MEPGFVVAAVRIVVFGRETARKRVFSHMFAPIWRFLKSEDGPTSVEYCVMLMLILMAVITVVQLFGQALNANFQDSLQELMNAGN